MADFFSSQESFPDYSIGRRSQTPLDSGSPNRLLNLLATGLPRAPTFVQLNKRRYSAPTEQVVNNLTTLSGIVTTTIPFAYKELSGLPPLRPRTAQMPYLFRPTGVPSAPLQPLPPGNATDFNSLVFRKDALGGMDFENEIFLTPPSILFVNQDIPNPIQRKYFDQPLQYPSSTIGLAQIVHTVPFHQNDWTMWDLKRKPVFFDYPPNLLSGVYNIPAGPPWFQTDWVTPRRSYNKHVGLWECINSQIPDLIPPPAPVTVFAGGGRIFGTFSSDRIIGVFS